MPFDEHEEKVIEALAGQHERDPQRTGYSNYWRQMQDTVKPWRIAASEARELLAKLDQGQPITRYELDELRDALAEIDTRTRRVCDVFR